MGEIIFNLFLISGIVAFITDISQFPFQVEEWIAKWLGLKQVHIKLLECSLCQCWWSSLLYLICVGELSIPTIAITALTAGFTFMWKMVYDMLYTLIVKTINYVI